MFTQLLTWFLLLHSEGRARAHRHESGFGIGDGGGQLVGVLERGGVTWTRCNGRRRPAEPTYSRYATWRLVK